MKKKLVSTIILIVVFSLLLQVPALAAPPTSSNELTSEHYQQIYDQLNMLIVNPSSSLSSSALGNLQIGNAIPAYRFTNSGLETLNFTIYPIFSSNSIPYIALQVKLSGNRTVMQVSENSIPELSRFINTDIAMVYDSTTRHVLSNGTILSSIDFPIGQTTTSSERAQLTSATISTATSSLSITYTKNSSVSPLNYTPSTFTSRSSSYVTMSVPVVYQIYDNICWAACVASITNHLTGSSYTAMQIAQAYANSTIQHDWNVSRTLYETVSCLRSYTGVLYYNYANIPTQQSIYNGIAAGYPLIGFFQSSASNHAVVIRGIAIDEWIQIMDPWNGNLLAYREHGTFQYVEPTSSNLFTLAQYIAK